MRNSSLVKRSCAENVTGLKLTTEATGASRNRRVVGERSVREEAIPKGVVDFTEVRMLA